METGALSVLATINQSGFLIAAICICISCLYFTMMRFYSGKLQNRIFLVLLLNILISAVCCTANVFLQPVRQEYGWARALMEVNTYVYFLLHAFLAPLFCYYMALVTGTMFRLEKKKRGMYELPVYVCEVLVLTNPLTKWVYRFDGAYNFVRNKGELFLYFVSLVYFVAAIALALIFWRAIDGGRKKTIAYFFLVIFVGVLAQLLFQDLQTEIFGEALAITGFMITLENEESRRISGNGIYNLHAFMTDINARMVAEHPFSIICVKMANPQNLLQLVGQSSIESLTASTAKYLESVLPKHDIYYTTPGVFLLICDHDGKEPVDVLQTARTINERFHQGWNFQDRATVFNAYVFCVEIPKDFQNPEQIMALIKSPLPQNSAGKGAADGDRERKQDVFYGSDLNVFLRRTQVEKAVMEGLKSHSFAVYYQPIYDAKDMSIKAGEALLRFHDKELGEIYPDEFLPVAERSGLIFELEDFVLDEVCKFLNSGIPVEMGVETLNVNLSVVQSIQPSYAERIIQQVSQYDIDPKRISFEIVESAATTDFEGLSAFVRTMRAKGFRFSVDDYGVGYSNVHSIFSLDVDVIKIDRTILWEAEQSEIGRIIMESSVDMIKRMKKKILISGVENKAQIDFSGEFGVDYLQGFYFSNPVSQSEFISILKATQLARVEEQRALAANAAMSSFLANMSHEIRTPINAVLGMDEMILRESGDEKIIEYARNIKGAGRTLLSLINDILDFSKIEAGNMDIVEAEYNLSTVLGDVVSMVQIKAAQKGLRMVVDVDPGVPEALFGDEMRLRQIMLNLLNNAVKYTKVGTVSLQVDYEKAGKDRINLNVAVWDTGVGIKEEDMGKLFQKFQRLDQDHNNTIEGSGLGLAITQQLLELMNGSIEVKSTYGQGSKFTIHLPQQVVRNEPIGDFRRKLAKADKDVPQYEESFRAPDARILVVDDTPLNLVVVREFLKRTQIQIDTVSSGRECLERVVQEKYDVILLDYRMPEMDGIETLKKLKAMPVHLNSQTPVVALTANAISGARERFLKDGFDDYMTKPIDAVKLEEMLLMYLPSDKIRRSSDMGSQGNQQNPGLDREQGIRNCGSEGTYQVVLKAFRDDIADKSANLQKAYDKKDWQRYAVEVHAIKSSARMIGADELSKLAEKMELAAEVETIGLIEANHARLLDMYQGFQEADVDRGEEEKLGKSREGKPYMSEKQWRDACQTLREFAQNMDMDNSLLVLESMQEYNLHEHELETEEKIRLLITQLKWEELILLLDDIEHM
ncbi:MAG: EAL domain-containing protein [Lachnospiraceae bacterium]|nr:EAL domain-containing protein [Lachnospiraceae bacterium]